MNAITNKSSRTKKRKADLVKKFPAEVSPQHAAKWLGVPAQLHPAKMLLQSQLSTPKPWLGQCANQKTALLEVVQSLNTYWQKYVETEVACIKNILNKFYDFSGTIFGKR